MVKLYIFVIILLSLINSTLGSNSIITYLSSNPEFKEMIYLLQESRMIPLINRLNGTTLLALNNDVLKDVDKLYPTRRDKEQLVRYHLLDGNYTLNKLDELVKEDKLLVETYLYKDNTTLVQPLGPYRGQMLKIDSKGKSERLKLGNVKIIKGDLLADNGIIHVVDNYLIPPPSPLNVISNHPNLTYFNKWLQISPQIKEAVTKLKPTTMFLFEDSLVDELLNSVEVSYLNHSLASSDRNFLCGTFIISAFNTPVVYYQSVTNQSKAIVSFNLAGGRVIIDYNHNEVNYNNMPIGIKDILTSNGVIHLLSKPKLPYGLDFDGMKYLIGLNATQFYNHALNSSIKYYINSKVNQYTVLVPPDDSFQYISEHNEKIEDTLFYHLLKGAQTRKTLNQTGLVITMLDSEIKNGVQQRIKIEHTNGEITLNQMANLIGDSYTIKKTNLIKISSLLETPPNLMDYLNKEPDLSNFVQLIKAAQFEKYLKEKSAFTGLFPSNIAFSSDGQELLMNLLLKNSSRVLLEDFIKFSLIPYPVYSTALEHGNLTLPTLFDNSSIKSNFSHGKIEFIADEHNYFDSIPILHESDQLIRSGVIHKINHMLIPPTLYNNITAYDILKANQAKTFLQLLKTANLTYILTNHSPVKTMLVPSDQAFSKVNMTLLTNNIQLLKSTLEYHLLIKRLPNELDSIKGTISIPTLSKSLPNLKIIFINNDKSSDQQTFNLKHVHIRTEGAPSPLYQFDGNILSSEQTYDMSIAIIDQVLFLPPQGNSYGFFDFLRDLILGSSILATFYGVGYLAYYRYFPVRANGYEPILD